VSARILPIRQIRQNQFAESLGVVGPILTEYRMKLQKKSVAAAETRSPEMADLGAELTAFDRWRAFELGRNKADLHGGTR